MVESKNIIITGTSRGIGYQLALQFANQGYHVIALSRTIPKALKENKYITCLSVDLSQESDLEKIKSFLLQLGQKIHVLIHNAGMLLFKPFEDISSQEFEDIYKVNVFGVAHLTRICLPFLQKGSHVVTISSIGGVRGSVKFSGLSAYSSSKGAVITLSELWAEEYKERGIAFNVLALGAVQTEMLQKVFPEYRAPVDAIEMAEYIYNFALTGSRFFNGKVLEVSSTTP